MRPGEIENVEFDADAMKAAEAELRALNIAAVAGFRSEEVGGVAKAVVCAYLAAAG